MAIFHLVRHGMAQVPEGTLAGRTSGYGLANEGQRQIERLVPLLARDPLERIYASPLQRTQESARLLASGLGLPIETAVELNEIDYGDWSGRAFGELETQPEWNWFNEFRSGTGIPNGELMLGVQARVVSLLVRLRDRHAGGHMLIVTHGDVIRAAILHFLGMPLDFIQRIRIDMGSLSTVRFERQAAEVLALNRLPEL